MITPYCSDLLGVTKHASNAMLEFSCNLCVWLDLIRSHQSSSEGSNNDLLRFSNGGRLREGLEQLREIFAKGPDVPGSNRAGQAERGIGSPETVAQSVSILAQEVKVSHESGNLQSFYPTGK